MVEFNKVQDYTIGLFNSDKLERFPDEWGFTCISDRGIAKIGYATKFDAFNR